MAGLLLAFMNPPADDELGFNAWYDEEHVPDRAALEGFLSARRYTTVEPDGPRYLALYDALAQADPLERLALRADPLRPVVRRVARLV